MQRRASAAAVTVSKPGGTDRHRVTVEVPRPRRLPPSATLYPDAAAARNGFEDKLQSLQEPNGSSGIFRVRLYVDDRCEREELVVRLLPNLL